ncbi:hypothetical protein [Reyranella soli]|uniref:Uncharacterized protein n=1 Tax=Reyranella soli TaxID=1230389 RepID=A0A512NEG6_9HYPH|nr:hypothetical protein [Reyranella soli]GEP57345.1 hypothetical protein RSO01_45110 [Reyranella soli]
MAKHVSTTGPRVKAQAKTGAFEALDGIENALIDLQSTAETFRALVDATIDTASTETDTMLRHMESDVAQVRAAFDAAFKSILGAPKGGVA